MISKEAVVALISELYEASRAYYQDFTDSPLTDEEFDAKLEYLKEISVKQEVEHLFTEGTTGYDLLESTVALGTAPAAIDIIEHDTPMLSLQKAKTMDEIKAFIKKTRTAGATNYRIQPKLDGFAMSAHYIEGKLSLLSTRGDGTKGEVISYLIRSDEASIVGLPLHLTESISCEVRGEAYLSESQFKALTDDRNESGKSAYKNPRNALVGLVRKANKGVGHSFEMTFAAYGAFVDKKPVELTEAAKFGVLTVDDIIKNLNTKLSDFSSDDELIESITAFGALRETLGFPTDGAVIKPENESEMLSTMGASSHHPKSQIAFKYPAATAVSTIEEIYVTVGKTGRLTPVAKITPTALDGSVISRISLHNFNYVHTNNLRVGQTVEIHKANDIIPQVKSVIFTPESSELIPVPKNCPICEEKLPTSDTEAPKTLLCTNQNCESREFHTIRVALGKDRLDIDGMSEKLLENLVDSGLVSDLADIFTLTLDDLADSNFGSTTEGGGIKLGESRAKNILNHIESAKSMPCTRVIPALGVTGLGRRMTKLIMTAFPTLDQLLSATVDELTLIEGVGEVRATTIVEGLTQKRGVIEKMKKNGVLFPDMATEVKDANNTGVLSGLSFSISGAVPEPFANRNAWVEFLESEGASFDSSPKKTTSFMVGDESDSSSKVKKAISLGVAFVSPSDFTARFTN